MAEKQIIALIQQALASGGGTAILAFIGFALYKGWIKFNPSKNGKGKINVELEEMKKQLEEEKAKTQKLNNKTQTQLMIYEHKEKCYETMGKKIERIHDRIDELVERKKN